MKKLHLLLVPFLLTSCSLSLNLVHKLPRSNELPQRFDYDLISRTSVKTLDKIDECLLDPDVEDFVISPASYLLSVAGLSAVSENFNNEAYGLSNADDDVKSLLTMFNFAYKSVIGSRYNTAIKSAVLHQQVGDQYKFDINKRREASDKYISTMVSSQNSYKKDANAFFKNKLGMKTEIPDLLLSGPAVLTYGALKMHDYVPNGFDEIDNEFISNNIPRNVKTYDFGSKNIPQMVYAAKGENYYVFSVSIRFTDLLIILPNVGVSINDIDVSEAYSNFIENADYMSAYGYIPYFHNITKNLDLTKTLKSSETGDEVYFDKLLCDDVVNDISILKVLQSSDFEFNKYGVAGESITVIEGAKAGCGEPDPIDLRVNRPFYAISLMYDFPLFVNKVVNPQKL